MSGIRGERREEQAKRQGRARSRLLRELGETVGRYASGLGRMVGKLANTPRPGRKGRTHNPRHLEGEPTRQEVRAERREADGKADLS